MATIEKTEAEERVEEILNRAKRDGVKGRYYVYERYKSELLDVAEASDQLEKATIELARILRV